MKRPQVYEDAMLAKGFVPARDVAAALQVHHTTIFRLLKAGTIKAEQDHGAWYANLKSAIAHFPQDEGKFFELVQKVAAAKKGDLPLADMRMMNAGTVTDMIDALRAAIPVLQKSDDMSGENARLLLKIRSTLKTIGVKLPRSLQ
jgi:hypothetical protein